MKTPAVKGLFATIAAVVLSAAQAADIHLNGGIGLPEAVATQVAAGGGRIFLGDGTYKLTATLDLPAAVEIIGEGTSRGTVVIDAQGKCRAVNMSGSGSRLANLTVCNGYGKTSGQYGMNVLVAAAGTVVSNCVVRDGRNSFAGGSGANIYMTGDGRIVDCLISGGYANGNNSAGGYSVWANAGRVVRCRIVNGTYTYGTSSAVRLEGTAVLENCFVGNSTGGTQANGGCVVAVCSADAKVVNCTVANNVSGWCRGIYLSAAGKVYNTVMYNNGGTAVSEWGNKNGDCFHNCASTVAITGGTDCRELETTTVNVFEDETNYRPIPGSQLVNAGTDPSAAGAESATDLDGLPRVSGAAVDIGCHEVDLSEMRVSGWVNAYAIPVEGEVTVFARVTAGSDDAVSFDFDFGDGTSETGVSSASIVHRYAKKGLYPIKVTGHCGGKASDYTIPTAVRVAPSELHVATTGSDEGERATGHGTAEMPYRTISYALNSLTNAISHGVPAIGGVTIHVVDGEYPETGLVLGTGIAVEGNAADRTAVKVGATSGGVFTLGNAADAVRNITIRNGRAFFGGNVNMTDGVVSNCVITGGKNNQPANASGNGGNVYMTNGRLVDCWLVGGEGNDANSAPGASVLASGGRIVRCRITDVAYTVKTTQAVYLGGPVVMENCLVCNNKCGEQQNGSVVYVGSADAKVVNCTVANNSSGWCRGIYLAAAGKVYNTVMYDNGGTAASEWGNKNGGCFYNCASTVAITGGSECRTLDVVKANVFENDANYVPLAASPLVNAGDGDGYDSLAVSETDLVGNRRKNGDRIDIGCYEVDTTSMSVVLSADAYAVHVGDPVNFTCTVVGGSGGVATRDYDFGDGKSASGQTADAIVHAYDEPGYYTVKAVGRSGGASMEQTLAMSIRVVPSDLYVATTGSDEGERTQGRDTAAVPYRTIGYALNSLTNAMSQGVPAIGGVTIHVADGEYPETGLVLGTGIVVEGNAADRSAVKVGATSGGVFTLGHAADGVRNMTICNGRTQFGGNVYMTDGVVSNCVITGGKNNQPPNVGCGGGNVNMANGLLVDCTLIGGAGNDSNTASGASVMASGGRIVRCQIRDVTYAVNASEAVFLDGTAVMENCLVCNNRGGSNQGTGGVGSVVYVNSANVKVVNCTVVRNVAGLCRGIYLAAAGKVYNTVIYDNGGTAAYEWGGKNAEGFVRCAFAAEAGYSGSSSTVLNVTDAAFRGYAKSTVDPSGLTPRKGGPLENAGGTLKEYEGTCGAISSVDLLGRKRCTGFGKLDIGCLESAANGLAVILY